MKKIISLFLCLLFLLFLLGCRDDGYRDECFYGVVRWSQEGNQQVVYIPGIGEAAIPEHQKCIAGFDGYGPNESTAYKLKEGDFVAINFRYEKSWDDDGVRIMECYPARFDRKASLIEALAEHISFQKTENGYELSFAAADRETQFYPGAPIYFVYHSGKNGRDRMSLVGEGTIIDIKDGKVTSSLRLSISEEEFFEKFTSISFEMSWETS